MKVELLSTCFLLTSAIMAGAVTVTMSPPLPAQVQSKVQPKVLPAPKSQAKVTCPCNCPNKAERRAQTPRHAMRHYGENSYYHYWAAASVRYPWREWRRAVIGSEGRREEGLRIEDRGWSGGVGYAPDGGGGFVDGYGQVHFANGTENGPTYDSYNQSFQFNPSRSGPFQPRLMGGFAPPSR